MRKRQYLLYKKNLNRRIKIFRKLYIKCKKDILREMNKNEISRIQCIIKDLNLSYKEGVKINERK